LHFKWVHLGGRKCLEFRGTWLVSYDPYLHFYTNGNWGTWNSAGQARGICEINPCVGQTSIKVTECATFTGNFQVFDGGVGIPNGVQKSGSIVVRFSCDSSTTISFDGLIYGRSHSDDSMYVRLNSGRRRTWHYVWTGHASTEWTWRRVGAARRFTYNVNSGDHTYTFTPREDGAFLKELRFERGGDSCKFLNKGNTEQMSMAQTVLAEISSTSDIAVMGFAFIGLASIFSFGYKQIATKEYKQIEPQV